MRIRYIFHNKDKKQHPFPVKSDWEHPDQQSVALETYLEEVKGQLAETELFNPQNNLPFEERKAIRDMRSNSDIVIKKADTGSATVIMNTKDWTQQGHVLLDDKTKYTPLLSSTIGVVRGVYLVLSYSKTWPSCVLSFVLIMTVVEPLSAFLITMSEFDLMSLIALRSSKGKLFRGLNSSVSASWPLTSSK